MTLTRQPLDLTEYPDSDGKPMTESDPTRDYLVYCVEALRIYFQSRRNVYVSGNLFIYYERGNNKAVVSPDVFVVFGVSKRKRRSYQVWKEENKVPAFILEITSKTTKGEDEKTKPELYARLGVQEYFQYDPTGDYLQPQLKGYQLVNGHYQPIEPETLPDRTFCLRSQALGLDLRLFEPTFAALIDAEAIIPVLKELRLFDPQTGEKLLTYQESEESREQAEQARLAAVQAREQAEQARLAETQAREQAEQARLAAIPRLQAFGLTEEQIAEALGLSIEEVRQQMQR
jgi:Uma2 family endonuclease/DNA-binding CsgD family transcriptional regulator